ncbi:MAG: hydrogenase iron-sulfur subunit [Promethearchaeota archaeon]
MVKNQKESEKADSVKKNSKKAPGERIGVFVCHCGTNIEGVVDCKALAEESLQNPGVVHAEDYKFLCSEPGQKLIKDKIEEMNLDRVVVAACSPRMHEKTFRRVCQRANLNPFLFEQANIREQCTWVHMKEHEKAHAKAGDLIAMSIAKAREFEALDIVKVPITKKALIIGGGIAGISAALDLADMGIPVTIVEKTPTIGGRMAQLDKTFPTMDCSSCILTPKMTDISMHPNITLLTYSEVTDLGGFIGSFEVSITKKPNFMIDGKCTGCGDCVDVCPAWVSGGNPFEMGMAPIKSAYIPFPQAIPQIYTIDADSCIKCGNCEKACEPEAIDLDQEPEIVKDTFGVILLATGFKLLDLSKVVKEYHYSKYENVITHLELERILSSFGPSDGHLIRPSDNKRPKKILFISCVGSRSQLKGCNEFCCNVGCMAAMKEARLIMEHHPDTEIHISYIDVRAPGKGYEEFWEIAAREYGIKYVRGRVAELWEIPKTKNVIARVEDTLLQQLVEIEYDLVVLVAGVTQWDDLPDLVNTLNLQQGADGWILEAHPKLRPVDTNTAGIFTAGFVVGPKDIPAVVSQAKAAASGMASLIMQGEVEIEPYYAVIDPEICGACEVCEVTCPYDAPHLVVDEETGGRRFEINPALCKGCGTCISECKYGAIDQLHFRQRQIFASIERGAERFDLDIPEKEWEPNILAVICNWCTYTGADLAGTSRIQYPPNVRAIRVMCSGRFHLSFAIQAFLDGWDGVLVGGCHPGDCHYSSGNMKMLRREPLMKPIMEHLGLNPKRFRLEWCSASEGQEWARINKEFAEELKAMGQSPMRDRKKMLRNKEVTVDDILSNIKFETTEEV